MWEGSIKTWPAMLLIFFIVLCNYIIILPSVEIWAEFRNMHCLYHAVMDWLFIHNLVNLSAFIAKYLKNEMF